MNDQAANRLLKTLEEPPSFAHLMLLRRAPRGHAGDDRLALPARALRSPARPSRSPSKLADGGVEGGRSPPGGRARSRADMRASRPRRCTLGGDARERRRTCAAGARARRYVRAALAGAAAERAAWSELLERGQGCRRARPQRSVAERLQRELELMPAKDRGACSAKRGCGRRAERRARAQRARAGAAPGRAVAARRAVRGRAGAPALVHERWTVCKSSSTMPRSCAECAGARGDRARTGHAPAARPERLRGARARSPRLPPGGAAGDRADRKLSSARAGLLAAGAPTSPVSGDRA